MKKRFFISILLLVLVSCLEPPHDNEYDAENPDKARLEGTVYNHRGLGLPEAHIVLVVGEEIIDETFTDTEGKYMFDRVNPGIYTVFAEASFYRPEIFFPESLPAGSHDTLDFYFQEIFFDFEREALGTTEPHGFNVRLGDWEIAEDNSGNHSAPNVYNGYDVFVGADEFALSVIVEPTADFWFETKLKVLEPALFWQAGIALRLQNELNFYLLVFAPNYAGLYKIENGDWTLLTENYDINFSPGNWYSVAAELDGTLIKIYFEDNVILEADDSTFQGGLIGLWVKSLDPAGAASVNFDDISLWP